MKRLLSLFALLFLASVAHATTWPSPSCSLADVQATINAGSTVSGDTVQINGPCTTSWASFVTIPNTKGITVAAVGGVTIGTTSQGFILNAGATTPGTRITGFTCNNPGNVPVDYNGHCLQINMSLTTTTWRIDHWTMCSGGGSCTTGQTIFVSINGNGPGLMDHVTMLHNGSAAVQMFGAGNGCDYTVGNGCGWTDDIVPGGPNTIFYEDNIFTNTGCLTAGCSEGSNGWEQSYGGARWVSRHNTINTSALDAHGSEGGGNEPVGNTCPAGGAFCEGTVGTRWVEIYDNNFNNVSGGDNWFAYADIRAGSGVVFNNTVNGTNTGAGQFKIREENTCPWPNGFQIGAGLNGFTTNPACTQHYTTCAAGTLNTAPMYFWNNSGFNLTPGGTVQLNRDYFVSATQPASMHWIVKAGDTCSTTYVYTPYPYPHPLTNPTSTPQINISQSGSFGVVPVGTASAPVTFTFTNAGAGTQTFTSIAITGGTDFARATGGSAGSCPASGTIAPSAACTFGVVFTPTAQGTRTATLTMNGTATASTPLNGTGQSSISIPSVPTNLTATATTLAGGVSVTLNWTPSTGTPTGYNCLLSLTSGGPYTSFGPGASPVTTPPCSISGLTVPGNHYFVVSAFNSAGTSANTPEVIVNVPSPTAPNALLAPINLTFQNITQGSPSPSQTITLTNTGTATLSSISISIGGPNAADFGQSNTCGATLAVNANCLITATFTPSTTTNELGSVIVVSNDPNSPDTVSLAGNGVAPVVLNPSSLGFGNIYINRTSSAQTVTYNNVTGSTITFTSVLVTGGDSTQFVLGSNGCTGTLATGSSCTASVTFQPTSVGGKTSALVFTDNATGSPHSVTLTGNGRSHHIGKSL